MLFFNNVCENYCDYESYIVSVMKTILSMEEKRKCSYFKSTENNLEKEGSGDNLTGNENAAHKFQDVHNDLTVDALHPLFNCYKNMKRDASTNTESRRFYCQECNSFIDLLQEQVIYHFSEKKHKPIAACVYCRGDVFEYFYYEKQIIFHKCENSTEWQIKVWYSWNRSV